MRRCFVFAFCLLNSTVVCAQQDSPKSRDKCVIAGIVVKSGSSEPIKQATVSLGRTGPGVDFQQNVSAVSDEQGRFEFKDVPAGAYQLQATRNAFAAGRGRSSVTRLSLVPGQQLKDVVLRLFPAAVISGRVVNENGEPMPNVPVEALQYSNTNAGRRLFPMQSGTTDDLGNYRVFGLVPGRYYVRTTPTRDQPVALNAAIASAAQPQKTAELRYPTTYYPGVTAQDQAAPLELHPADEATVNFNLTPVRGVHVRGRIIGASRQASGIAVTLISPNGFEREGLMATKDGQFDIGGVLPGSYQLIAIQVGEGAPTRNSKRLEVSQTDLDGIQLDLTPRAHARSKITGQLRVDGNTRPDLTQLTVFLQPADLSDEWWGNGIGYMDDASAGERFGAVKADGSFTLQMPELAGRYYTTITARSAGLEDYYTENVRYGGKDITDAGLPVPANLGPLEIVIAADGATVEGQVVDAKNMPLDNASVVVTPTDPKLRGRLELNQSANTDQNGRCKIRGVRPGEYKLFAWDGLEDAYPVADPEFMHSYESQGQLLHAERSGRYSFILHVLTTDEESQ